MNRTILIAVLFVIFGLGLYYFRHPLTSKVKIRAAVFTVEVALTEPQKESGLGNRTSMAADHGMLFVYDHKEQYNYWMKGMEFPLDFIWIDGKTVADITPDVPPPIGAETPIVVKPKVQVDKVFEVNAGTIRKFGIQTGDQVEFLDR